MTEREQRAAFDRACREQQARAEAWLAQQPLTTRMKMWPAYALVGVASALAVAAPPLLLIAIVALLAWAGSP